MIIIGHSQVPFKPFYWVKIKEDIKTTPPNSVILFKQNNINFLKLVAFCKKNKIIFANEVNTLREALISNANGASYMIVSTKELAKELQNIANTYLFDARILLRVTKEEDIKNTAKSEIDGVLFPAGEI